MPPGEAEHLTEPWPWASHSLPEQEAVPLPLTWMCVVRTALSALTQAFTSDAFTYFPSQKIAPLALHWVVHWLERSLRHWAKLLSWHFS